MGMRQIAEDDLTGIEIPGDAPKPVKVTVGSKSAELYLSPASYEALTALASGDGPAALTALLVPKTEPSRRTRRASGTVSGTTDTALIRAWLRDTPAGQAALKASGKTLSDRGRIDGDLKSAYSRAHANGAAPVVPAATIPAAPASSAS